MRQYHILTPTGTILSLLAESKDHAIQLAYMVQDFKYDKSLYYKLN